MGFSDFYGNAEVVQRLREMLKRDRFPHAIILAGPEGAGKYTLALKLARTMNCLNPTAEDGLPSYCGSCSNCQRIAGAEDLEARCAEAVELREGMRETDKREARILVQTHPDVLIIPPDPPQMMIKVDQVRHVIGTIRYRPQEARRRIFIFTSSSFMKEAANSLLKILEEPPEFATILLLARHAGELLPTIRSRCLIFTLSQLSVREIEQHLIEHRPEWNDRQRQLAARISGGAIGKARSMDLEGYIKSRKDALAILHGALQVNDHSDLFRTTETYRAGAEGKEKTDQLLAALYSLLKDILAILSNTSELVRNADITSELRSLAANVNFEWITNATRQLSQFQNGMRRNVLRPLALDALALSLER
ncbi:MAG TPA: DNA polymerase III subunit delta' [Candidatus Angelobacter sp.]|jgi:DNA polymerase-3 subunit delta'|nr:DNA polymerase III subunit delta' [Candidatus Angelobacter sp.]